MRGGAAGVPAGVEGLDASIPIRPSRGGGWGTVIFLPVSSRQDRTATGFDVRARKARRQPGLCCLAVAVIAAGVTRRAHAAAVSSWSALATSQPPFPDNWISVRLGRSTYDKRKMFIDAGVVWTCPLASFRTLGSNMGRTTISFGYTHME